VVKISYQDHLDAIPETLWHLDDMPIISRARIPLIARAVAKAGFKKLLTGDGLESVLGILIDSAYLEEIPSTLSWLAESWLAPYWRLNFRLTPRWRTLIGRLMGRINAACALPPVRLYYPVLCVLRHNGMLRDTAPFLPPALGRALGSCMESTRVREAIENLQHLPLVTQLKYWNYRSLQKRYLQGKARLARACGVTWIAPAVFLFQQYLPLHLLEPSTPPMSKRRLRTVIREGLPGSIASRGKNLATAILSPRWFEDTLRFIEPLTARTRQHLGALYPCGLERYFDVRLNAHNGVDGTPFGRGNAEIFALWYRLFFEGPPRTMAPRWSDLEELRESSGPQEQSRVRPAI